MNDDRQERAEGGPQLEKLRRLVRQADAAGFSAPAALKHQVLSRLQEESSPERRLLEGLAFWKRMAILTGGLSVAFAAWIAVLLLWPMVAPQEQRVALRVHLDGNDADKVAFVEIELPEGVSFHSEKFPELGRQRTLRLSWRQSSENPSLPVVLKSKETGEKPVTVRFLSSASDLLAQKRLPVRFGKG